MTESPQPRMKYCNVPNCSEAIEYLPFRCKYCGKTYCKIHRLPENHNCSFEMKATSENSHPTTGKAEIPINSTKSTIYNDYPAEVYPARRTNRSQPKSRSLWNEGSSTPLIYPSNKLTVTYTLIGLNVVFFIITLAGLGPYFLFNISTLLLPPVYFLPIVTSLFIPDNIISAIFTILILYSLGKMLENKFGPKFLLLLYFTTGLFTIMAMFLLELLLGSEFESANNGIFMGFIAFVCLMVGLEREMSFLLFFIPVRLKAKYLLYFLIGFNVLFGVIGIFSNTDSIANFGSLAGMLGAWVIFKRYRQYFFTPPFAQAFY
jgi:membrane associated rhomboid family serine protease